MLQGRHYGAERTLGTYPESRLQGCHLVQDAACCPDVSLEAVSLTQYHLRGQVVGCAHKGVGPDTLAITAANRRSWAAAAGGSTRLPTRATVAAGDSGGINHLQMCVRNDSSTLGTHWSPITVIAAVLHSDCVVITSAAVLHNVMQQCGHDVHKPMVHLVHP